MVKMVEQASKLSWTRKKCMKCNQHIVMISNQNWQYLFMEYCSI